MLLPGNNSSHRIFSNHLIQSSPPIMSMHFGGDIDFQTEKLISEASPGTLF